MKLMRFTKLCLALTAIIVACDLVIAGYFGVEHNVSQLAGQVSLWVLGTMLAICVAILVGDFLLNMFWRAQTARQQRHWGYAFMVFGLFAALCEPMENAPLWHFLIPFAIAAALFTLGWAVNYYPFKPYYIHRIKRGRDWSRYENDC